MRDDDDVHEPEHDHLLDREFFDDEPEIDEAQVHDVEGGATDDLDDEDFDHPAWHDSPDD
ncbi:hypothetical protein [Pseudomonas phoenicis]|uniref:hypothetical protein n=1 Tax=unclassified Pseudomonas TaxID=196821 RepID=UPI0039A0C12C